MIMPAKRTLDFSIQCGLLYNETKGRYYPFADVKVVDNEGNERYERFVHREGFGSEEEAEHYYHTRMEPGIKELMDV